MSRPIQQFIRGKFPQGDFAPREPDFGVEFWDANFWAPNFWAEFFGPMFSNKKSPLENSPSRNSAPSIHIKKIHPRIRAEKFTSHFCRAMLLIICGGAPTIWALVSGACMRRCWHMLICSAGKAQQDKELEAAVKTAQEQLKDGCHIGCWSVFSLLE